MQRKNEISKYVDLPELSRMIIKYDYYFSGMSEEFKILFTGETNTATAYLNGIIFNIDNDIIIYDFKNFTILKGHTDKIHMIKILPNNDIVSAGYDNTLSFWDSNFECYDILPNVYHETDILPIQNGVIVSMFNDDIVFYKQGESFVLENNEDEINTFEKLDEDRVIIGSTLTTIWNLKTLVHEATLDQSDNTSCILVFNNLIILGTYGGKITLYNSKTFEFITTLQDTQYDPISCLFPISESIIASGSDNGKVGIWNPEFFEKVDSFTIILDHSDMGFEKYKITSMIKLPDGNVIIGSNSRHLYVYNPQNGQVDNFETIEYSVKLILLPDYRFVNVMNNGILTLWE